MNYGEGVWGNAALNTVVMCPDLRKRCAGQTCSRRCVCLPGDPAGEAREASAPPGARMRAPPDGGAGLTLRRRRGAGRGPRDEIHTRPAPGPPGAITGAGSTGCPTSRHPARGRAGPRPPASRCGPGRPAGALPGRPRPSTRTSRWSEAGSPPMPTAARPVRVQGERAPRRRNPPRALRACPAGFCRGGARYVPPCPFWAGGLWGGPAITDDDRGRDAGGTTTIQPPNGW